MSPMAGAILLQVRHIIAACVLRGAVRSVGAEDEDELVQDGTAQAARMIDAAERRGKALPSRSVAHFILQGLKAGRRHGGAGRSDVLSPGARLDGRAVVVSMDEPGVADDEQDDDRVGLHAVLAAAGEDTDVAAARRLDWEAAQARLDGRRLSVLRDTVEGYGPNEIAARLGVSAPRVIQLRQSCGKGIKDAWGDNGIRDVVTPSNWRAGLRAGAERRTARYEKTRR